MKVERIPRDRAEKQIEDFRTEKGYWQEVGRRISSLRDSSRFLYSFQNPFSERSALSSDETILTATANRQAAEQQRSFTVRQIAKADRFLSSPMDNSFRVDPGNYSFGIGNEEITLNYRGGTLKDFTEALNRRGRGKLQTSVINVQSGKQSLLIESLVTGAENRLAFSGAAEDLVKKIGLGEKTVADSEDPSHPLRTIPDRVTVNPGLVTVKAGDASTIGFSQDARDLSAQKGIILSFETSTKVTPFETITVTAPSGPAIPGAGSVSYGGITIENDSSTVPLPKWEAPPVPVQVNDMSFLGFTFTDGSSAILPLIQDSTGFYPGRINLDEYTGGRTIASLEIVNNNTNRDFSIRNVTVFNPNPLPKTEIKTDNILSTAQDAIIVMDGIEIKRPSNEINDLVPGVTIIAKTPSDRPVSLNIEPDREAIKEAIVTMVGNYNRLMQELNILTRNDERVLQELSYLSTDERAETRKRLGIFAADSTLNQFRTRLQQTATGAYETEAGAELSMLAQIGIGTDPRRSGASAGHDPSRLRGYLEIDVKVLDAALLKDLKPIQQLFGYDTTGDLIANSGVAFSMEGIARPFVETGGIISLKTNTIDSKIGQEERRIATLDRQLEAKEASLKRQYGLMESAFDRMEKMGTSLDNFSRQANSINNSRR
jgi:flagellar hook-associated protein 2